MQTSPRKLAKKQRKIVNQFLKEQFRITVRPKPKLIPAIIWRKLVWMVIKPEI